MPTSLRVLYLSIMQETIRLGIAGGGIGRRHTIAFRNIEGIELTAFSDPSEETRKRMQESFGFSHTFADFTEMVQSGKIDAVVVATPTHLRSKHVSEALEAGLHTLGEMPPCGNYSEMSRIATAASLIGKVYMFASHHRFAPEIAEAHKQIANGDAGDIFHADTKWQWAWWPYDDDNWRGDSDLSGGALLDMGASLIDAAWYAMGSPSPVEAMATQFSHFMKSAVKDPERLAEDTSTGMVRFKNGASLNYSVMCFSHIANERNGWNSPEVRESHIYGIKASYDLENAERVAVGEDKQIERDTYAKKLGLPQLLSLQAKEFISSIREEREPINSAKEALELMKMMDALKKSAKEKEGVPIKVERSLDDLFSGM
ncbi:Gfo/Idh/MocA family oxidoreductase [Puniceicoccaceae bacterium K14]|nr:Gfo/Idh/MocA family oxidoreductase [Puniceicoccaceae bacterium K14]